MILIRKCITLLKFDVVNFAYTRAHVYILSIYN
nr:MAG TPA: hypothetical protein [Bacteriophage sp.]